MKESKLFFPNLDGLRFLAFFLVYLQHGFGDTIAGAGQSGFWFARLQRSISGAGGIGVSFFFVLSGFLITYLILAEIRLKGRLDVLAFYVRRSLRIWPLYFAVIIFGFFVYPALRSALGHASHDEPGQLPYYALFLGNFDLIRSAGQGAMYTTVTWSVAIEEQYYLVWPLVFFFTPSRLYKFLFPSIVALSALFRFWNIGDPLLLYFHTLSVISDMAVGGAAAFLCFSFPIFVKFFVGMRREAIAGIYVLGCAIIVFSDYFFVSKPLLAIERIVFSLVFAFIILEQNYGRRSLFKMSSFTTISTLGKYTYGLYLLHPIALLICSPLLKLTPGPSLKIIVGILGLFLSIGLSYASYHLLERPFLKQKAKFAYVKSRSR